MDIYNLPPETDIPRALANEGPAQLHADLSDTKAVKKSEEVAYKDEMGLGLENNQKRPEIKFLQFIDFEKLPNKQK